jgi:crotonobetainyl-CoA:carnitine CoA-transferase CaiB-like acyl-CoA transferase
VKLVASPIKMSGSATTATTHPPLLAEHTGAVLAALGYDAAQIAALRQKGVV